MVETIGFPVTANQSSAGDYLPIDSDTLAGCTVTNSSAYAVEYSTGGTWTTIAAGGSATINTGAIATTSLRFRKKTGDSIPVVLSVAVTHPGITPAQLAMDASGSVTGITGPLGTEVLSINVPADKVLSKYGRTAADICLATQTVGTTTCNHVLTNEKTRFSTYTRKATPTANTQSELRFPGLSITADPDDLSLSMDVYVDAAVNEFSELGTPPLISVILSNATPLGSNYVQYQFGASYLRQGWNTLKMRAADDVGVASVGNLPFGMSVSKTGTGVDFAQTIQYAAVQMTNLNGVNIYIDQIRRSAKARPMCVLGFDATSSSTNDNIFIDSVAPLFRTAGAAGYVTFTNVYEAVSAGGTTWARIARLVNEYGWEVLNHTWSHGAGEVGRVVVLTSASRTSNLVTVTFPSAHNITLGKRFKALIAGATPSDMNGVFELTATTSTQATYTANGVDGAGSGTIRLYTFLAQVLSSDTPENRRILAHELSDTAKQMRSAGMGQAANIVAYPNNSVPELTLLSAVCAEAQIDFGRSTRGGFVFVNEFGVDNPLHFGSFVFDSGTYATTTSYIIAKIQSAIARGEHIWLYGHYIQDEATAGGPVDLEYAPGAGGNPSPPGGALSGTGGWWYLGQLKRVINEAIIPAVRAGQLEMATPSQWAARLGYKGVRK